MDTTPYWIASYGLPEYPALDRNADFDVVVVGGGITGVTTAYLLTQAGCRVALVERERCATIDTGHTTAHLTHVMDKPLHRLVADFGKDHAREAWRAGRAAIDQIVANTQDQGIECDFRWLPGYLHTPVGEDPDDHAVDHLRKDAELAREFGFMARFTDAVPVMGRPGVKHADQAAIHPRKYLGGLLRALEGTGSRVYEKTAVEKVEEDPLMVHAGGHRLRCEYVVIATHVPLQGISSALSALLLQTKLYLHTSYVLGAHVPPGSLPAALFWDTGNPYQYMRVDRLKQTDYVILGGEDHKTGQAEDTIGVFGRLQSALLRLLPQARVDRRWSGQVVETPDGLPYIGETSANQFVATGFMGQGMTFGTLSAMMATDAYLAQENPWKDLFAPDRKAIKTGAWTYAKENADLPRYLAKRWFTKAHDHSVQSLGRDEGAILSLDGHKVAAYRDGRGRVTLLSPICTHLKCVVAWNAAERTWDCPCHGSRFKATGEVIAGPAAENLRTIEAPEGVELGT